MITFALFTDVSVNPQRKLGIGGYLLIPVTFLENEPHEIERGALSAQLKIKRFTDTSSTKLELQTVLWALEDLRDELAGPAPGTLQVFTDSQCVTGLLGRRKHLTENDYISKRSRQPLPHALLYRELYAAYDRLNFQLNKVTGHSPSCTHDTARRIFSYVDREVRKELTLWQDQATD